jgi:hypothetical protein
MGTLTGQQINQTYDGLLKLADSTTGITSSLQSIQDGLGNDTGSRIGTNYFTAPNVPNLNFNLKPDFAGTGFNTGAGSIFGATTQNKTLYTMFYDSGNYAYSAVTYNLGTLSSTSDVVSMAFYSMQMVPQYGIAPKDLIMSGITLESRAPSTTGVKTTLLPSTLSFTATGGGFYIAAINISNGGVTPTVRYGSGVFTIYNQSFGLGLGLFLNAAGTTTNVGSRAGSITNSNSLLPLNLPFQTSYTDTDIRSNLENLNTTFPGFGLNVIR